MEISSDATPKVRPNTTSAPTASTSVSPAGSAFKKYVGQEMSLDHLFVGLERQEEGGTPMVNILISDTWEGSSG